MANSKQYILSLFPDNNNNEISAADMRIFVNAIFDEEVDTTAIIDNLFSTDGQVPLSANQGRIVDGKITIVEADVSGKENSLGLGSVNQVLTIDLNSNKVWQTPTSYTEVVVYDGLDSVSSTLALSANQGRVLNSFIKTSDINISANTQKIENNIIKIDDNSSAISTNIDNISGHDTRITNNRDDIQILASQQIDNTNNIDINKDDILFNKDNIDINTDELIITNSKINANIIKIDKIDTYIGINDVNNNFNIGTLNERIEINVDDINVLQALNGGVDLSALRQQVNNNSAKIDLNIDNISNNGTQISLNSSAIGNNSLLISANASNILNNTQNISTNLGKISNNSNIISQHSIDISKNTQDILINEGNINNNSDVIVLNTNNILLNKDLINDNSIKISKNTTDIFNNKQDIEVLQVDLATNTQDIGINFISIETNRNAIILLQESDVNIGEEITNLSRELSLKENGLGDPGTNDYILSSKADGTRSWVENAFSANQFTVEDNLTSDGDVINALSANQGYILDQKIKTYEPDLGLPSLSGMILTSAQDGTRTWVEANILNVDYGSFFGTGFTLNSITIGNLPVSPINNKTESGTWQLICSANITLQDSSNINVDVTEDVIWFSSNTAAYTITSGIGGGFITCTKQSNNTIFNNIDVSAELNVNAQSASNTNQISIDNAKTLKAITITPPAFQVIINNASQLQANGEYFNNDIIDNITTSCIWSSSPSNIASVGNGGAGDNPSGLVSGLAIGQSNILAALDLISGTSICDVVQ